MHRLAVPLCLATLLVSAAAAAQSPIRTLADLLRLREGQEVQVQQPKRAPLGGTLVRVVDDHFCVQFKVGDALRARCYPYSAILAVAPSAPDEAYYVIEVR